jgi:Uma2 family endonuclease
VPCAGRPEYWIVNLIDRVLEVRRDPVRSPSAPYGWQYATVQVLGAPEVTQPLAAPTAVIAVAELLP